MVEYPIYVLSLIVGIGLKVCFKLFVADVITSNSETNVFEFYLFETAGGDGSAVRGFFSFYWRE